MSATPVGPASAPAAAPAAPPVGPASVPAAAPPAAATAPLFSHDLAFNADGLIPVIVQQHDTGEVLMMAWMNAQALSRTQESKEAWFWSRSRQELWHKGATSGNFLEVKAVSVDCDADCLLLSVDSPGPACHTGARSCFYRRLA